MSTQEANNDGLSSQAPGGSTQQPKVTAAEASRAKHLLDKKAWRLQLKRTQQYLGLVRPIGLALEPSGSDGDTNFPDQVRQSGEKLTIPPTPSQASLKKGLESYIVFTSVDCEAYEFLPDCITEIGISTLDTRDLVGVEPGVGGSNWNARIHSRHLRILEHKNKRNKVHVQGCPDDFSFGESEWISGSNAPSALKESFNPSTFTAANDSGMARKVVFVAHDSAGDEDYLAKLGFDLSREAIDIIDTIDVARAVLRNFRQCSLMKLLSLYGINAKFLHNAGNDARYTLQLLVAMALKDIQSKKTAEEWEMEKERRIQVEIEKVKAMVDAEYEGWSTDEDDVDVSINVPRSRAQLLAGIADRKNKKCAKLGLNSHQKHTKPPPQSRPVREGRVYPPAIASDNVSDPAIGSEFATHQTEMPFMQTTRYPTEELARGPREWRPQPHHSYRHQPAGNERWFPPA